jgi:hypothetical protein
VDVTVIRLLEAALSSAPGGSVTYLAEIDPALARDLPLSEWHGELFDHPLRLPYARAGGPARDLAWAYTMLDGLGVRRSGPPRQIRTWNLSSLWCIPTEQGNVWLKCVPPFFAFEGEMLAALHEAPVPRLLAHESGRILMPEIPGEDLYGADVATCIALVTMLVDLQRQWIGREKELFSIGLPDWRAGALTAAIEDTVTRTEKSLSDTDRQELHAFVAGLPARFEEIAGCGVPSSFVHGDFAPGNARGDGDSLVILDWGDAGVGHPLLDQAAFLDRIAADATPEVYRHWIDSWRRAQPGSDPERAAQLLEPIASARQAVIYRGFLDHIEPSEHPYHEEDPATWLVRTAALARGARAAEIER